ncbi:hypothetical protein O181_067601 [Austropuccinia psidii MF-1]|uniref:Uncharacterized protein n=1 Tax=Austropuccinia psidii MF-1 TaxID=1389203 RepID=A0A9Q3EZY6_9BASI|nr:hypothetical protein [Austropuccinia psidii MF-1]
MPLMLPSDLLTLPPTGLILNSAHHPYTNAAPSRCDSNAALTTPYTSAPTLILYAAYNPYTPAEPSGYASDAATSSPCSPLLMPLHLCRLPFLHSHIRSIGYVPESGSETSDMVSSHELGIEVESLSHESNPDTPVLPESHPSSSQKPNFKSYEKEKTAELCVPTEEAGQDDIIFSGEVEIISKEQFVSNITQTIPSLEKLQKESKIPDYVNQKISEAMGLLKMDFKHK